MIKSPHSTAPCRHRFPPGILCQSARPPSLPRSLRSLRSRRIWRVRSAHTRADGGVDRHGCTRARYAAAVRLIGADVARAARFVLRRLVSGRERVDGYHLHAMPDLETTALDFCPLSRVRAAVEGVEGMHAPAFANA